MTDEATLHFEDIDVGDERELGDYHVTKDEIIEFAEKWDPQPFHVDEAAARDSIFGELVASALHTLCICHRVAAGGFYQEADILGGAGIDRITLPAPVRPGDTLTVSMTVADKRPLDHRPDCGLVRLEFTVANETGQTVMTNAVEVFVGRRESD